MLRNPWEWMLLGIVIGIPLILKLKRSQNDLAFLTALIHLLWGSAYILLVPAGDPFWAAAAALSLLAVDLRVRLSRPEFKRAIVLRARTRPVMATLALLTATLAPLAMLEVSCRLLTNLHLLKYHLPIETVWKAGPDDWRVATITADEHREPDPVLLWRPAPRKPYTSQRFKGPVVQIPKPSGVSRVMCYGDSLTDGPPKGSWPTWLHSLLNENPPQPGRTFEVMNAGVSGYSSRQGLLRFLQEVDRYQPDLLLVSYGWNDAAQAIGQPDKMFRPPSWPIIACQRALVRYRSYLVLTYYLRGQKREPEASPSAPPNPRVAVDDYLANLDRFRAEAEARNIPIVFLTRPHMATPSQLSQDPTWRKRVPAYNTALSDWARRQGLPLIDVQRFFEHQPTAIFSDECHFTHQGYLLMAEIVRDRLFTGPQPLIRFDGNARMTARVQPVARPDRPRNMERTASVKEP